MEEENILDEETYCLNELNHYTSMYFDYLTMPKESFSEEHKEYLVGFVQYCKEHIYHFAEKLLKSKGDK